MILKGRLLPQFGSHVILPGPPPNLPSDTSFQLCFGSLLALEAKRFLEESHKALVAFSEAQRPFKAL